MSVAADALFLEAARAIGGRLASQAVWHEDRCTWLGDDVDARGEVVHRSLGGDLYAGTAGIGWFLAELWALDGGDELAAAAAGALRHSLARSREATDASLYTGLTGAALAAVTAGRLLGDDELVARGARAALDAADRPGGEQSDLVGGTAGTVLGLLALAGPAREPALLDAAVELGHGLLAEARRLASGAEDGDAPLCGLAHGASGLGLALLELADATGDARFASGARAAFAYERPWFSRSAGSWPDLRGAATALAAGAPPPYPVHWCHGAGGIGLARLRAWAATGDETALAEAAAAVETVTVAMLRLLGRGDERADVDLSLCHGVGSALELQLVAAELTGDQEHLEHARRLGGWALVGRGPGASDDAPFELPELRCGVPGGGETAGLMLGLAGIGAACLRLHDPDTIPSPLVPWDWTRPRARPAAAPGQKGAIGVSRQTFTTRASRSSASAASSPASSARTTNV